MQRPACHVPWSVCHAQWCACHVQRVCLSHAMTAIVIHMSHCHDVNVTTKSMQCECNENMMMSCLHHADVKQTMMTWSSSNVNTNYVMPPHSYVA